MSVIKDFLKQILPPPVKSFMREINNVRELVLQLNSELSVQQRHQEELTNVLAEQQKIMSKQLITKLDELASVERDILESLNDLKRLNKIEQDDVEKTYQVVLKGHSDLMAKLMQSEKESLKLAKAVEQVQKQSAESTKYASEAVWAEIFNNTISGSKWLRNRAFAPGRWAVGYPALYVMYRVLNEAHPKRILELGLGQSTRMIAQYAAAHENIEHIVVEHDADWITFFQNDFELSEHSKIVRLEREMIPYKDAAAVRVFKNFKETFEGQKFDFIFIDAPLGGDMKEYARIDVLQLLPSCLSNDFVIMIDDCDRIGETHTVKELEAYLKQNAVEYKLGRYSGRKDCILICAKHLGFLTSL